MTVLKLLINYLRISNISHIHKVNILEIRILFIWILFIPLFITKIDHRSFSSMSTKHNNITLKFPQTYSWIIRNLKWKITVPAEGYFTVVLIDNWVLFWSSVIYDRSDSWFLIFQSNWCVCWIFYSTADAKELFIERFCTL